ncbi:MAG TPA: hypothetical protein VNU68_01240, partial [Verrucomicrobiae bacterium]|nr:hypothetical protein [Verrucomicrobiae bacterium]
HTEMKEMLDRRLLAWPRPIHEWPKEVRDGWSQERSWACRLLDKARKQLNTITLLTDDQGRPTWTRNNARQFDERGKNDFAYASLHAVTRFLVWLHSSGNTVTLSDEDAALGW